ncbi:MAG TPA: OsmC family protein [Anaerolineales bacterium]
MEHRITPTSYKTYHVTATRVDDSHTRITARGHELTLNIKKGAGEAGFNAAETLLAALGACLLTNVNAIGQKMRLDIRSARIEFDAARTDEPPTLTDIRYQLILESPEPPEKLKDLADLCFKWGTVTTTLVNGLVPKGALVIEGGQQNEQG